VFIYLNAVTQFQASLYTFQLLVAGLSLQSDGFSPVLFYVGFVNKFPLVQVSCEYLKFSLSVYHYTIASYSNLVNLPLTMCSLSNLRS